MMLMPRRSRSAVDAGVRAGRGERWWDAGMAREVTPARRAVPSARDAARVTSFDIPRVSLGSGVGLFVSSAGGRRERRRATRR